MPRLWIRATLAAVLLLTSGCAREALREFFDAYTPHERYVRALRAAGLDGTALGRDWLRAADASLARPVGIRTPFREESYLDAREATAVAYEVALRRGQRVVVTFETEPDSAYQVFLDLFHREEGAPHRRVASADSLARTLDYVVRLDGDYLVRVQPELLRGGRYTVTVAVGPTLAFPVEGHDTTAIRSRYGAARDAGRRRHEGLDIFARRGTPVLAAADGIVRSTRPNRLGGTVVWLRDDLGRSHYYAHLERQIVRRGQRVRTGDTIGFVGNSGNARSTPPHLHFGLYARGSFDPYPALYQPPTEPEAFAGARDAIGATVRTTGRRVVLRHRPDRRATPVADAARDTPLRVEGGTGGWYRVRLPDGARGFVEVAAVAPAEGPIGRTVVRRDGRLFSDPGGAGIPIDSVPLGVELPVLGSFGDFLLVEGPRGRAGWMAAN